MHQIPENLITATIGNFCALSNIGRSKVYELLDAGELQSIKIGKRRLILIDSYRKLIEQQRTMASSPISYTNNAPQPMSGDASPGRPQKMSPSSDH